MTKFKLDSIPSPLSKVSFVAICISLSSALIFADDKNELNWWPKFTNKPVVQNPQKTEYLSRFAADGIRWKPELNETSITQTISSVSDAGLSAIYLDVFSNGETLIPSMVFPQKNDAVGTDWLSLICQKAHEKNIKVHAWVQVLCWKDSSHSIMQTTHTLISQSDDLLDTNAEGSILNPTNTDIYVTPSSEVVTDKLTVLLQEICAYDIDGINLDSLNYNPYIESGYNTLAVAEFKQANNITEIDFLPSTDDPDLWDKWKQFRQDKLTSLTEQLVSVVKDSQFQTSAPLPLSVCIYPSPLHNRNTSYVYQAWQDWLDTGLIDFSTPLCHAAGLSDLERQLREMRSFHQQRDIICIPDLDITENTTPHPLLIDQKKVLNNVGFRFAILRGKIDNLLKQKSESLARN